MQLMHLVFYGQYHIYLLNFRKKKKIKLPRQLFKNNSDTELYNFEPGMKFFGKTK